MVAVWGNVPDAGNGVMRRELNFPPVPDPSMGRADDEPPGVALFLAGAAMGAAGSCADCFGARFFQTMGEDRVGMRCRPAVG